MQDSESVRRVKRDRNVRLQGWVSLLLLACKREVGIELCTEQEKKRLCVISCTGWEMGTREH